MRFRRRHHHGREDEEEGPKAVASLAPLLPLPLSHVLRPASHRHCCWSVASSSAHSQQKKTCLSFKNITIPLLPSGGGWTHAPPLINEQVFVMKKQNIYTEGVGGRWRERAGDRQTVRWASTELPLQRKKEKALRKRGRETPGQRTTQERNREKQKSSNAKR